MSGAINVGGTFAPAAGENTFPVVVDTDVKNGLRVVANHAGRNAIDPRLLSAGAIAVLVSGLVNPYETWQFTGSDPTNDSHWTAFASGGAGIKWAVADDTALGALAPTSADVNAMAFELDNQTLWVVVDFGGGIFGFEVVRPFFGTGAGTTCEGNDSRLSDARAPTAHHTTHQHGGSDEVATATPGANAIPKAGGGGTLADGWISSTWASKAYADADAAAALASAESYADGKVASVSGTAPIVSSGGTTPAISISAATSGAAGSMSASDKGKLDLYPAVSGLTTGQPLRATGAGTCAFGALDLANTNAVTGTLPTGNQASQAMGGDCSGTTGSCTVAKVNGTTYPAGGSLTTGTVPRVTASSTVAYGALDLANANAVTGLLPIANVASGFVKADGSIAFSGNEFNSKSFIAGGSALGTGISEQDGSLISQSTGTTAIRGIISEQFSTDTASARVVGIKARGTAASPTTVANADNVTRFIGYAYDGTSYYGAAYIGVAVDAAVSTGVVPMSLGLYTGSNSSPTLRFSISSGGTIDFQASPTQGGACVTATVSSSPYAVTTSGILHLIDTSSARTINLPNPSAGGVYIFHDKTGSAWTNNITFHRNGSEQIEGIAGDLIVTSPYGWWVFWSDGTNWWVSGPI